MVEKFEGGEWRLMDEQKWIGGRRPESNDVCMHVLYEYYRYMFIRLMVTYLLLSRSTQIPEKQRLKIQKATANRHISCCANGPCMGNELFSSSFI
jgi:hypothetical protein